MEEGPEETLEMCLATAVEMRAERHSLTVLGSRVLGLDGELLNLVQLCIRRRVEMEGMVQQVLQEDRMDLPALEAAVAVAEAQLERHLFLPQ